MFNKDFYPTPTHVIESMGIDCNGKIVLEPSAGKGNIIDWLREAGAKEILACEINLDLAKIVKSKALFLKHDFFSVTPNDIGHIHMIIMNPPFGKGAKHILHAWNIAPAGCEIISLINNQSLENDYSNKRRELNTLIEDYGSSINLGNSFVDSERKTFAEIGLVKLYKPKGEQNEFDGFFMDEDPAEAQENGIMKYNAVRDVVERYINSVKCFEEHLILAEKMNRFTGPFNVGTFSFHIEYNNTVCAKDDFKKQLQKKAWKYLFGIMNLEKFVTSGVMKDVNSFVENQTKVPFTMKNIYKMFEIIVGTRENTFNRSLVEVVDRFTMHTNENRYCLEGWKTNAGYLLNKKIIIPYMVEMGYSKYLSPRYSQYGERVEDLIKVLCNLTATNYDRIPGLRDLCEKQKMQPNSWYDWGFFKIKGFKKGTLHMQFKNDETWAIINRAYAKVKGQVLPEKI